MDILSLPAEIVRLILQFLDPESFYICLLVCKIFREHALDSTSLLKKQLDRLPGQRFFAPEIVGDAEALLKEFGKRSSQHLHNGAFRLADAHVWRPRSPAKLRISKIVRWPCTLYDDDDDPINDVSAVFDGSYATKGEDLMYIEVLTDLQTVNLYRIEHDTHGYHPQLWHIISAPSMSSFLPMKHKFEITKVATWVDTASPPNLRIAILYQSKRYPEEIKLVLFKLDPRFGAIIDKIREIHNPDHKLVTDLKITRSGRPVVLYRQHHDTGCKHTVIIYGRKGTEDEYIIGTETVYIYTDYDFPDDHEIPSGLIYRGAVMHINSQDFPQLPRWTVETRPRERIRGRLTDLTWQQTFRGQSQGVPLATHHRHSIEDPTLNQGEATCVNSSLSLVISRSKDDYLRTGAYLLKAVNDTPICNPWTLTTDLEDVRHYFVAQLFEPPDLTNLSTLGLGIAVSPKAHRIALSNWKTIHIYALCPQAFLDPDYSLGEGKGVPGDYAFVQGAGWQYYRNEIISDGCVVLLPLTLEHGYIIYGMEFRGEDELWAWTDKGLCRYNFGVGASAMRELSVLE
ncbi:hypothetical protein P154DRAFT_207622 [Amniculicola lignicola CBS 123094]|uniref:F-box domain-containing protein n=1 Tax=Amniculicola lignicola CBS 123094 TaxID=1392246 RepID=A0A6A5WDV9_9PLEO|nr:hypothetical protein P154DRAFT_207622 [Amniculicola lignicola CBS 123094]